MAPEIYEKSMPEFLPKKAFKIDEKYVIFEPSEP